MKDAVLPPEAEQHVHRFKKSLSLQMQAQEVARAIRGAEGLACLDIGATNGMFCHQLRKLGGTWSTMVPHPSLAAAVRAVVGDNVHVLEDSKLPFKKKAFDVVVATDFLPQAESDESFIEECHRVLKPDGRLIVNVSHRKPFSLINAMRRAAAPDEGREWGPAQPGFSEAQIFRNLKNGFDVLHVRSYSRFCVEFLQALLLIAERRSALAGHDAELRGLYSVAYPFQRLAYQFDMLLLLTRGFRLIATAKRHVWLPRAAPILVDGRSISEAVLSRASG